MDGVVAGVAELEGDEKCHPREVGEGSNMLKGSCLSSGSSTITFLFFFEEECQSLLLFLTLEDSPFHGRCTFLRDSLLKGYPFLKTR